MREHTEKIKPPRALWVPFELGRPLGAPGDAEFQIGVLRAALALLEQTDGPVLEDYPLDAPKVEDGQEAWVCPISLPAAETEPDRDATILAELESLRSWHDLSVDRRGRTTVGLSTLDIDDAARFLAAWARGETPDSPNGDISALDMLRLCCEDIKAYYMEAATAQPGRVSGEAVAEWFWAETRCAKMLLTLRDTLSASDDKMTATIGGLLLVPYTQMHRQVG